MNGITPATLLIIAAAIGVPAALVALVVAGRAERSRDRDGPGRVDAAPTRRSAEEEDPGRG